MNGFACIIKWYSEWERKKWKLTKLNIWYINSKIIDLIELIKLSKY